MTHLYRLIDELIVVLPLSAVSTKSLPLTKRPQKDKNSVPIFIDRNFELSMHI